MSMFIDKILQCNMDGVAKGQPVPAKELPPLLSLSERTFTSSDPRTLSILHVILIKFSQLAMGKQK